MLELLLNWVSTPNLEALTEGWIATELWIAGIALVVCHHGWLLYVIEAQLGRIWFTQDRQPRLGWSAAVLGPILRAVGGGVIGAEFYSARRRWLDTQVEWKGKTRSTFPLPEALNWDGLVAKLVLVRFSRTIPVLLVGIGILGTFTGLLVGIQDVQWGDESQLTNNVTSILEGMKLAFATSIFGIGLSLAWSALHHVALGIGRWATVRLQRALGVRFPYWQTDEQNAMLLWEQQQQSKALRHLGTDFATALKDMLEEALSQSVAEPLKQFVSRQEELQSRAWDTLAGSVSEHLYDLAGKEFDSMREMLQELVDYHIKSKATMWDAVNQLKQAAEAHGTLLAKLDRSTASLDSYAASLQSLQPELQDSVKKVSDAGAALRETAESTSSALNAMQLLQESVSEQLVEMRKNWNLTESKLQALTSALNKAVAGFKEDLVTSLTRINREVDELLGESVRHFSGSLQDMQDTVEELPGVLSSLKQRSEELQAQLLEQQASYAKVGEQLTAMAERLQRSPRLPAEGR